MSTETNFDMDSALSELSEGLASELNFDFDEPKEERKPVAAPTGEAVEPEGEATPKEGEEPEVKDGESAQDPNKKPGTPAANQAPGTWRPEAAKHWAALPPEVQAEIQKREQDMFNGINQYKTAATFGLGIAEVLQPYDAILSQYNIDPRAQIADLMQSHYTLAFGTEDQKVALIQQIMSDFKIDPAKLGASSESAYVDPQVKTLQDEISSLKSQLSQMVRGTEEQVRATLSKQVEEFASRPTSKYFNELMPTMTELLNSGVAKNVEEAYEKAKYINPAVREKVLAEEREALASRQAQTAAARAAKAAQAASPAKVVSRHAPSSDTAGKATMDDTLEAAYDKLVSGN